MSRRADRLVWLESVLANDPDLQIAGSGEDIDHVIGSSRLHTDVIVVDLELPQASEARFWSALHVYFTGARLMALVDMPIDPARLESALHAGAYYIVDWREPVDRFLRAARAAGYGTGFIPLGAVIVSIAAYFGTSGAIAANIRIRDGELDIQQSNFRRGKLIVSLTKLELELLVYLSSKAGCPISTEELLLAVWHQAPNNTYLREQIKSTIKRLRQKLEPEPSQPRYLLNRHGHGYYVPGPDIK